MGHYLEDLRSDFSAIHRVDPEQFEHLPAPRAYALAYRISAYQTVIRTRQQALVAKRDAAVPRGPREMKAGDWLASRPEVVDQISKVPYRLDKQQKR